MPDNYLFKDESDGVSFNSLCIQSSSSCQLLVLFKHKFENSSPVTLTTTPMTFTLEVAFFRVTVNCSSCDIVKKHCDLSSSVHFPPQVTLSDLTRVTRGVLPNTLATVFEQDVMWNI